MSPQGAASHFVHSSSFVDEPCEIGAGTKIWHFSHIMKNCRIGENCNIGQNVVVSPDVVIGRNGKIQNNVFVLHRLRAGRRLFLRSFDGVYERGEPTQSRDSA
jgi:UDP-2-acetamido-3-amino-2,3-dideoxy-glucuronate N-acetyltransferase